MAHRSNTLKNKMIRAVRISFLLIMSISGKIFCADDDKSGLLIKEADVLITGEISDKITEDHGKNKIISSDDAGLPPGYYLVKTKIAKKVYPYKPADIKGKEKKDRKIESGVKNDQLKINDKSPAPAQNDVKTPEEYYNMLLTDDGTKQVLAEKGLVELGDKGREYLINRLKEINDENLKWRVEAVISQIK